MDDTGRVGDPEAVEIFPQLFHFIAPRNAVILEMSGRASVSLVSSSSQISGWLRFGTRSIQSLTGPN